MPHLLSDLHIHTIASGHAFNTVDEIFRYAEAEGYSLAGIADHGPNMEGAPRPGYFEMLSRLPGMYGRMKVLYGCEANILDTYGRIDVPESFVKTADYVIAGLHRRTSYSGSGESDNTKAMIAAMCSGKVDIISHPVSLWFRVNVREVVQAASVCNVMLESNKTVMLSALADEDHDVISAYTELFSEAVAFGVSIIFGSDAHHISEMSFTDKECIIIQERYGLKLYDLINHRPDELLCFLDERRRTRRET